MKSRAGQKFYRSETRIPSALQQEMLLPELQEHKELVTDQFHLMGILSHRSQK